MTDTEVAPHPSDVAPNEVAAGRRWRVRSPESRRFTRAALIGGGLASIPFLWVLWGDTFDPLRQHPGGYFANFYDLQARAMAHLRWNVPRGLLGIEGFIVDGKEYTYFPPFPSLLRMPILAVTHRFDGRLTAPSMLLAWVVIGVFTSLLIWRIRVMVRGSAPLGKVENASLGGFVAVVLGGSVLLSLGSLPWVYNEAFLWGAALTTGALFALLGVLEEPSTSRVVATGALTAAAVMSRTTVGWGAVIAAVLASAWFALGRGGADRRRWWLPILGAGLVPLLIGFAITWSKFGSPFIHPLGSQVWTQISAHRRAALAANGGSLLNLGFLPSTALAYFRPDGLHFSDVFPFITPPTRPPDVIGDAFFDQTYRTASIPASMPLLFGLGCWGFVSAFRLRPFASASLFRIPLLGAVAGTGGVLFYGYISQRYLGDFVPVLILAGAIGLVDVCRRLDGARRRTRVSVIAVGVVLAAFTAVANVGIAVQSAGVAWEGPAIHRYVERQKSLADALGTTLPVRRGASLPATAPADQLFVAGDCVGLYIATGEKEFPQWIAVERGSPSVHRFQIKYTGFRRGVVPLMTLGNGPVKTLSLEHTHPRFGTFVRFRVDGQPRETVSLYIPIRVGRTHRVDVVTDLVAGRIVVFWDGHRVFDDSLSAERPVVALSVDSGDGRPPSPFTAAERPAPEPELCQSLVRKRSNG